MSETTTKLPTLWRVCNDHGDLWWLIFATSAEETREFLQRQTEADLKGCSVKEARPKDWERVLREDCEPPTNERTVYREIIDQLASGMRPPLIAGYWEP